MVRPSLKSSNHTPRQHFPDNLWREKPQLNLEISLNFPATIISIATFETMPRQWPQLLGLNLSYYYYFRCSIGIHALSLTRSSLDAALVLVLYEFIITLFGSTEVWALGQNRTYWVSKFGPRHDAFLVRFGWVIGVTSPNYNLNKP